MTSPPYSKADIEVNEKLFPLLEAEELKNSDILIFHCLHDTIVNHKLDKPCILYDHLAGRPETFMFNEIKKFIDPMRRRVCEMDRKWILQENIKLYKNIDVVISNSKFNQKILKKYFNVDSFVVNPPVDLRRFRPLQKNIIERNYFFSIQRINWQKRILLQIDAFKKTPEEILVIAGAGNRDKDTNLSYIVKDIPNIIYLGRVTIKELVNLYNFAKATIQTGFFEDFGIVPIESLACGTPCIVVDEGGFKETIHSKKLGIRIKKPYLENLIKTIKNWDCSKYNQGKLRKEAKKYSQSRFSKEMKKYAKLAVKRHAERTMGI